ncbi:MAG: 3-hydroxyacyl-CoA dehydrogenase NAD-binding domain-containing protein [Desulforhabdus sp.]|jgi:3-hydroxyacyl-CoA dehydrogenase/enoyl-CoA hydratase/3-hydroxybutyryl-CoA epimerase|nr:3-hydroxyacyl-CoA dehydrogenase NAD-binding domain-containing protein [Desulforhabdus sp.]
MNYLRLEYQDAAIAIIHLDDSSDRINKLSEDMLTELDEALLDVEGNPAARGLILISDKSDNFVVGADLKELAKVEQPGLARQMIHRAHSIFNRLEQLSCPVIAAIHGHCLGGGMELALACHYRIATQHPLTRLGLPEVKLGLIPAGGGCQRLTRLLGARKALPLMLEGRILNSSQAKILGLIDLEVYPYNLLEIAVKTVNRLEKGLARRPLYPKLLSLEWLLRHFTPARTMFFAMVSRKVLSKTQGNYPAPELLLDCVETGIAGGMDKGLEAEALAFDRLVLSPESQALRQLFFATSALKKNPLAHAVKPVKRVGVLGAGLMGAGIAAVSSRNGLPVLLKDVSWTNLGRGLKSIYLDFDNSLRKHKWLPMERDQAYAKVSPVVDYEPFAKVDMVIEAVFEDLALKHQVLQEVEQFTGSECIFATNTSAIPISKIASASRRPELVIGMHYFSPVPHMPLLEVVVTPNTPDWVRATAVSVGQRQGKTVIVVKDGPGFYTSRILSPYIQEALLLLHEGARIDQVDEIMRQFGFPVGPFKLLDEVGIEVAAHVSDELSEYFSSRGFPHDNRLRLMTRSKYHGRKNGRGFYQYPTSRRQKLMPFFRSASMVNKDIYRLFGGKNREDFKPSIIRERLALIMLNEAALCLQDGIIEKASDGDVGAVLGLGFPPFLGGPFRYMDKMGLRQVIAKLEKWAERKGTRFKPAAILTKIAETGERFYN